MKTRHARRIRKGILAARYDKMNPAENKTLHALTAGNVLNLFTHEEREAFLEGRAYNREAGSLPDFARVLSNMRTRPIFHENTLNMKKAQSQPDPKTCTFKGKL